MEAGELIIATIIFIGMALSMLYVISPDTVFAIVDYLMNANIITVI